MKYWLIVTGLIFLTACVDKESETPTEKPKTGGEIEANDLETKVALKIKSQLNITAADKFDSTWYKQDLNGDGQDDYLITVNQLDRALNEALAKDKVEKMQEVGYMGYYNHFFFVDGASEEVSDGIVVPSSPMFKLVLAFDKILGTDQTDFYVDYRVRNMQRRKFYTIQQAQPREVCQAVIFDRFGTENTVAYDVRIEKGTMNDFNDIVEYEAQLEEMIVPNLDSTYYYSPTIIPSDKEFRRWHYSPNARKYYTIPK
ncbi:hypothetical protein N9Y60_02150 [Crocinitomicaceae bacterium]|nr:hypothetical protein [Crocinitomicaceae bacterium]